MCSANPARCSHSDQHVRAQVERLYHCVTADSPLLGGNGAPMHIVANILAQLADTTKTVNRPLMLAHHEEIASAAGSAATFLPPRHGSELPQRSSLKRLNDDALSADGGLMPLSSEVSSTMMANGSVHVEFVVVLRASQRCACGSSAPAVTAPPAARSQGLPACPHCTCPAHIMPAVPHCEQQGLAMVTSHKDTI